jgi:hypothetical protein
VSRFSIAFIDLLDNQFAIFFLFNVAIFLLLVNHTVPNFDDQVPGGPGCACTDSCIGEYMLDDFGGVVGFILPSSCSSVLDGDRQAFVLLLLHAQYVVRNIGFLGSHL